MPKIIGWGDKLSMSMCLLVKITTPIKLNLINTNSQALISQEMVSEKEVHYVQFEAIHRTYECNFNAIPQLWHASRSNALILKDWTITDFDYYLKGNPIIKDD